MIYVYKYCSLLRSFVDFNRNERGWIYEYIKAEGVRVFSSTLLCYCRSCVSVPIPLAARSKTWACGPRLLALWVRIPPGPWMSVSCGCCVLSGRGLSDDQITHPEESCRLLCVSLSGIRCNNNPQHLPWVGRRCQKKKEFLLLDSISGECLQICDWTR